MNHYAIYAPDGSLCLETLDTTAEVAQSHAERTYHRQWSVMCVQGYQCHPVKIIPLRPRPAPKNTSSKPKTPVSAQLEKDITVLTRVIRDASGIPLTFLSDRTRSAHIVIYRQIAHYILHQIALHSYSAIGQALGIDHATVMHSVKAITSRLQTDPTIDAKVQCLGRAFAMRRETP